MVEQQSGSDAAQFLLSDFNTRLRDIDERNRLIRERVLLLGKNLISIRQDLGDLLDEIKRDSHKMKSEIAELQKISKDLVEEFGKFVKRDEIIVVERMLRDFQPLEFMRRKDVEELIKKSTSKEKETPVRKQIKSRVIGK